MLVCNTPHPPYLCSGDDSLGQRTKSTSRPSKDSEADSGVGVSATEKRFAYSLLEKLLEYFERSSVNMTQTRPSTRFSRRGSYAIATEDVKFFVKVCLEFFSQIEPCTTFIFLYNTTGLDKQNF